MRPWQFWLNTLILSTQHNPPRFVELVMLTLAMILLGIWSLMPQQWPYLVLSLSYIIGSSFSILVRESLCPQPQFQLTHVTALLLLIISVYSFAELIR
jgi:multisubunit Na+/H+ antiporter MnhE subunit